MHQDQALHQSLPMKGGGTGRCSQMAIGVHRMTIALQRVLRSLGKSERRRQFRSTWPVKRPQSTTMTFPPILTQTFRFTRATWIWCSQSSISIRKNPLARVEVVITLQGHILQATLTQAQPNEAVSSQKRALSATMATSRPLAKRLATREASALKNTSPCTRMASKRTLLNLSYLPHLRPLLKNTTMRILARLFHQRSQLLIWTDLYLQLLLPNFLRLLLQSRALLLEQ